VDKRTLLRRYGFSFLRHAYCHVRLGPAAPTCVPPSSGLGSHMHVCTSSLQGHGKLMDCFAPSFASCLANLNNLWVWGPQPG
jgi:hypothetical protein